jgi:hypothetical protein
MSQNTNNKNQSCKMFTAVGSDGLGSSEESEISGSRVQLSGVSGDQPCAEVIAVARVVPVDGVVATRVVGTLYPNLKNQNLTFNIQIQT